MAQRIRLAWKQLSYQPIKFLTAIAGVMVAVMLMWIQLGILAAVYKSATTLHRSLNTDLVVVHPLSENMTKMRPFSSRVLYRAAGLKEVATLGEMYVTPVDWRNPATGEQRAIVAIGVDPDGGWLNLPGLDRARQALRRDDTFVFDRKSKAVFGPVVSHVERGEPYPVELNHHRAEAVGLTEISSSFGQEGSVVTNRANFLRFKPEHDAGLIHVGLIRLRPGGDVNAAKATLQHELAPEALVLTQPEFTAFELRYWQSNAPVGFVFTMGTIVGFFIGFIVVYQILYAEVSNHLPQFATMKAMGFDDGFLLRIVMRQGLLLSILGYLPGSLAAFLVYRIIQAGTSIPVEPTLERGALLLGLTTLMCFLSGLVAVRRLRAADPADVF